jgi:hypothetical protein
MQLTSPPGSSYLGYNVWPPYVAAILVGGLQLPLVLGMGKTLGGSTSMTILASQVFVGPLAGLSPYAAKFRWGFESCWQVKFCNFIPNYSDIDN